MSSVDASVININIIGSDTNTPQQARAGNNTLPSQAQGNPPSQEAVRAQTTQVPTTTAGNEPLTSGNKPIVTNVGSKLNLRFKKYNLDNLSEIEKYNLRQKIAASFDVPIEKVQLKKGSIEVEITFDSPDDALTASTNTATIETITTEVNNVVIENNKLRNQRKKYYLYIELILISAIILLLIYYYKNRKN